MRLYVKDIKDLFLKEYKDQNFIIDKTGVKTIELIGYSFIADEPYIFRKPNEEYIQKELKWYLSQSLNVKDLEDTPTIWKQVADKNGFINSNYGWCVFSNQNYDQYENCKNELKKNPNSRRAIMMYNRPSMWYDFNRNGMNDFMCTISVNYFIRNNKLITIVYQRSQDAVFGYNNDYAWQKYVSNKLASDLHIEIGDIIWNNGSIHLYERHFNLLDNVI